MKPQHHQATCGLKTIPIEYASCACALLFLEAQALLSKATRHEYRYHPFGDKEVSWSDADSATLVASGYFGGSVDEVAMTIGETDMVFIAEDARLLSHLGVPGTIERNDSIDPEIFTEGHIEPGLSLDDVYEELTSGKPDEKE